MGRNLEIRDEARSRFNETYEVGSFMAFVGGAEWSDAHPKEGLVSLDAVCDRLRELLSGQIIRGFHTGESYYVDDIIVDLRKSFK